MLKVETHDIIPQMYTILTHVAYLADMFSAMAAMLLMMLATDLNPPGLWFSARATLSRNCSIPWACIEIELELNYN